MNDPAMTARPVPGVSLIRMGDGSEIHLDDIATASEGQAILDDLVSTIVDIQEQLARAPTGVYRAWRARAEVALKRRRRLRPRLERRISELRGIEKLDAEPDPATSRQEARRRAFVKAAEEVLPAEMVGEVWAHAAERFPNAFADKEAS